MAMSPTRAIARGPIPVCLPPSVLSAIHAWPATKEPLINTSSVRWGYCPTFQFTSAKAERELGYACGPIEPAIDDAITWFRAHGMLPTR